MKLYTYIEVHDLDLRVTEPTDEYIYNVPIIIC